MATGNLVKLGGLYLGNALQTRPTRPWRSDTTVPGQTGTGNIPSYVAGQSIEIKDTPSGDAQKLQWIEVNNGGKKYLIADRNILVNVSWDDLNAQSLVTGKNVTIDGSLYKLRLLTAGSNYRNGDTYAGGTPTNNEWDMYITNELNLAGLPKPSASDLDKNVVAADLTSVHNTMWNWLYLYSWGQETYTGGGAGRAFRGFSSARYWNYLNSTYSYPYYGWRPLLEVLNSGPSITGPAENQGVKTGPFSIVYSAADPEFDTFSVVEKINGQTIESLTNLTSLTNREIAIDLATWNALALNTSHTISVVATDAKGTTTTTTWMFTKTNNAPIANVVEPIGSTTKVGIVNSITPILVHRFQDADAEDTQSAYQYVIEKEDGTQVVDTGKVTSTQSYYQVTSGKLNWSERYKYKVRVWDSKGVPSDYTEYQYFMPNRNPSATNLTPGSLLAEEPAQAATNTLFTWTFEDLDLEAQQSYQIKVLAEDESVVYNSNRVYQSAQQHQIPDGILKQNNKYHVELTVWDPNDLSYTTPFAYIQTNATPSTPVVSGPIDNYRTTETPTFKALVGTDAENDLQHFKIQIAEDETFTTGKLEYSSKTNRAGWKIDNADIPEAGVNNSYAGKALTYTTQVNLAKNKTYYWRICAIDASTGAQGKWSEAKRIRCGNKLQFETTNFINTGTTAARRVLMAASYFIAGDGDIPASLKVEVTNNAYDVSPIWENATEKFVNTQHYEFTNTTKTAWQFGIAARITINANDTLGEIYVNSLGITFD